ncbi:hypothetical protein [Methylobacterium sp. Gmos1]
MMTQQMQQVQQPPPLPPSDTARLLMVEKDVSGLKESMSLLSQSVTKGFDDLSKDMKARGTTNWQPVQIGLTIVTIAGGIFFTWVNSNTSRLETAITELKTNTQRYVPREDLDVRFANAGQRRDDAQRMTDARIERAERDIDGVQRQVVPRDEHRQRWVEADREMDGIRARVGRIEDRIDKRLDRLEAGRFKP